MSKGLYFDLDTLNGESFQELCAAILLNEFTPLAVPYGSAGRDGGIDARHFGELIDYSTLFDHPHKINSSGGTNIYWVFQAKHTRREADADRQDALIKNLENEIEKWLTSRWDKNGGLLPTCFVLMTNVRLVPSTRDKLEELGLLFEYFECWDEAKIAAFIALNEGIQRTFFPNKDDRCLDALKDLKSFVKINEEISDDTVVPSKKSRKKGASSSFDFVLAIEKLVNYQVVFTSQNNALAELFDLEGTKSDLTKDWPEVEVKASHTGLIALAENKSALEKMIQFIKMKNVVVYVWRQFVGEHVKSGEPIISFKCFPDYKEEVKVIANQLFHVIEGDNRAHVEVDTYLLDLQEKLLRALDSRRYVEFERLLSELYQSRTIYHEKRKEHPNTFYPNARRIGNRIAFGWDFISVWEKVYEDILDIVFKGTHTNDTVERLIRMPFGFCDSTILYKGSVEQFKVDFDLVRHLFFKIKEQGNLSLMSIYFEDYEKLCSEVSETEYRVESLAEAELFFGYLREVHSHLLTLLKLILDGGEFLKVTDIERYLLRVVSANFEGVLSRSSIQSDTWEKVYARQKEIHVLLSLKRDEFYFAWGTYLWWKKRNKQDYNFIEVSQIVSNVSLESLISLYEKTKEKDSDWFGWWFRPESTGRIMTWSSSIDHDIRELLIGALLTKSYSSQELLGLELLESESSVTQFLEDVKSEREKLEKDNTGLHLFEYVSERIKEAEKIIRKKIDDRISRSTVLSLKKVKKIEDSFSEIMKQGSLEGELYEIKDDSVKSKRKLQTGIYSIMDKIWFLEDQGYVSYASDGYGSHWAESLLNGRVQVIAMAAEKEFSQKIKEIELKAMLDILAKEKDPSCLIISHRVLPWNLTQNLIQHRKISEDGKTRPYIGNVAIIYESHRLKKGDAILIKNGTVTWHIEKRLEKPTITFITPSSTEGKSLLKKNPDLNLGLKVLVDARELGFVSFKPKTSVCMFRLVVGE